MEIVTKSAAQTEKVGKRFSADLMSGDVVALSGDLGAGKTTFIKGVAEGLGISSRINSPTFIIMRDYGDFYHVDLYRLEKNVNQEVENLGLMDIISEGKSIVVIEWAEKIKKILPKNTIWVEIKDLGEQKRSIKILKK